MNNYMYTKRKRSAINKNKTKICIGIRPSILVDI